MKKVIHNVATGEITEIDYTDQEIQDAIGQASEIAWEQLRNERNALLSACDWTVLSDTPTSTAAWKTYRQALRDLPANTTDPFNPEWPAPPA